MDFKGTMMIIWTVLGVGMGAYIAFILRALASEIERANLLLTVIANKQGATQEDVEAALRTK